MGAARRNHSWLDRRQNTGEDAANA